MTMKTSSQVKLSDIQTQFWKTILAKQTRLQQFPYAGGGTEIKLDSPEEEEPTKPDEDKQPSSPPSLPVTETAPSAPAATKTTKQNTDNDWITEEKTQEEVIEVNRFVQTGNKIFRDSQVLSNLINFQQKDEEESGDQFQMEITVTEPKKMGDGMGSYMAYKVNTKVC